jgi:hypothetical protein
MSLGSASHEFVDVAVAVAAAAAAAAAAVVEGSSDGREGRRGTRRQTKFFLCDFLATLMSFDVVGDSRCFPVVIISSLVDLNLD